MRGLLTVLALALSACGAFSPCENLQKKCNACKAQDMKDACNAALHTYQQLVAVGETDCQALLDTRTFDSC